MAEQLSSITSSIPGAGGLGSITGALQGSLTNVLTKGNQLIDRFFPPEKRDAMKTKLAKFATEKPYLASFLLSQLALSGPAIALFVIMVVTVFIFALLAGILIGVLGALLFVVAAVGFALIILLPILFFTTFAAVFFWLFGVSAYYVIKWFNQKEVPGIHTDAKGGLMKASGASDLPLPDLQGGLKSAVNGEAKEGGGGNSDADDGHEKAPPTKTQKQQPQQNHANNANAHAKEHTKDEKGASTSYVDDNTAKSTSTSTGADAKNHQQGTTTNQSHPRKLAAGKGATPDVGGAVGGVKGKVGL